MGCCNMDFNKKIPIEMTYEELVKKIMNDKGYMNPLSLYTKTFSGYDN